jgi:hypothetical protein
MPDTSDRPISGHPPPRHRAAVRPLEHRQLVVRRMIAWAPVSAAMKNLPIGGHETAR